MSAVVQSSVGALVGSVATGTPSVPTPAPSADVEKFQSALASGSQPPAGAPAVDPAAQAPDGPPAVGGGGDAILQGLNRMRNDMGGSIDRINHLVQSLNGQALPAQDLLKIQLEVQQLTLQQELMGKVAGKATQNLDTLVKVQ